MNRLFRTTLMAVACSSLLLGACKRKDKDVDITDADSVALAANADDEATSSDGHEMALTDADQLFNNASLAGGRVEAMCGATIDTGHVTNQRSVTFDGVTACGLRGVVRSGSITATLYNGENWASPGAVLLVTLTNYSIRKPNGKTIVYNGTGKIYNVNGGRRNQLGTPGVVIKHRIRFSNVQVTYNNHTFRNWNTAKTRTWTNSDAINTLTITGDTAFNNVANIGAWGTGRNDEAYYSQFVQPIVWSSACEGGPVSGKKFHNGFRRDLTVTFGVDANGNTVSSGCPYGFKFDFVGPRRSESGVTAY